MTKATIIRLMAGILIGGGIGALMGYFGKCSSGACPLTATPFRGAIYGAVLGIIFAYSFRSEKQIPYDESESVAIHINSQSDFDKHISGANIPVLADFFSNSCPPCRSLAPTIEELAREYEGRVLICKVNLDKAPELAKPHKLKGIPTVLFFSNGKEAERIVGAHRKEAYMKILDHMLTRLEQNVDTDKGEKEL